MEAGGTGRHPKITPSRMQWTHDSTGESTQDAIIPLRTMIVLGAPIAHQAISVGQGYALRRFKRGITLPDLYSLTPTTKAYFFISAAASPHRLRAAHSVCGPSYQNANA